MSDVNCAADPSLNVEVPVQKSVSSSIIFGILNGITWFRFRHFIGFFACVGLGWMVAEGMRRVYVKNIYKIQTLAWITLLSPVVLFGILTIVCSLGLLSLVGVDVASLGFLIGIVVTISTKPNGDYTVKLVVQRPLAGKDIVNVWLESLDTPVGLVRNKIAAALDITPASRVCLESGKGRILDDLNVNFFSLLSDSLITTDFFGFVNSTCFVTIKDAEPEHNIPVSGANESGTLTRRPSMTKAMGTFNTNFFNVSRVEAKFGVEVSVVAKIPNSGSDGIPFNINLIDLFAAASPQLRQYSSLTSSSTSRSDRSLPIRFIKWENASDATEGEEQGGRLFFDDDEDNGGLQGSDSKRLSLKRNGSQQSPSTPQSPRRRRPSLDLRLSGKPICNGDIVVLESEGKYMSVTRGWWMKWANTLPRRSGAFTVEVVARAQQSTITNKMIGGLGSLQKSFSVKSPSDSGSQSSNVNAPAAALTTSPSAPDDGILRIGDAFRLRSLKFPDYELGITNVKIRNDYCYMGLRKIGDTNESDNWCQEVWFYIKMNSA